ncbi:hypothetical protein GGI19_003812 [Coemansia pectinata]|uniref:FAD/NAD(P)-binding domain-containing protein n=1 Tax=Coemansia pectinata TaxID=1052879 RepID=A0A9W8GUY3_9FUNG|nr:hypothetical protein GGI19_003812 [Coemansia pectinata]
MHLTNAPIRIAVAGGNYSGLSAMRELYLQLLATGPDYDGTKQAPPNPNVKITLIDRRDGFVHYLGMTRGLCQSDYGNKLWVPYSSMPWLLHPSISVKKGIVSRIASRHIELVDTSDRVEFDYLVVALGLSRTAPIGVAASTRDEYLRDMDRQRALIGNAQSVVVVGGGAVGTELAADIKSEFPKKEVTLIHSHSLPIPGPLFTSEFRHSVASVLQALGVKTIFGERVVDESSANSNEIDAIPVKHGDILPELVDSVKCNATLTMSSGLKVYGDVVLNCLGAKTKASLIDLPSSSDEPVFSPNGIRVNESMQVDDPSYSHIFAAGDISNKDVLKFAGPATSGGRIAASNIARLISVPSGETPVLGAPKRKIRGDKNGTGKPEYGSIKLVLGERHAVIQKGAEVVPTETAIHMMSPDIKLGKATRTLYIGTFPTHGK